MKLIHQISFTRKVKIERELASKNIQMKIGITVVVLMVDDDCVDYKFIKDTLRGWDHNDYTGAVFDDADIANAEWIDMGAGYVQWYPKPDGDFGYIERTYDTSNRCESCGCGQIQNAPFRIKGEQNWKRKQVFQLNWVFDQHFTNPETWERVFKPFGIEKREVIHNGKGHVLETVVQLDIPTISPSPLVMGDFRLDMTCTVCSRPKGTPNIYRMYPPFKNKKLLKGLHAFRSQEWFGSRCEGRQLTIISNELAMAIKKAKIKGLDFTPLENS